MNEAYPPLVIRALECGAQWHAGQRRKHPTEAIPYFAHPAAVGFILQRAGYDDEVVAAGILHDVIEDCGVTKTELAEATTGRVADFVEWVSEDKKLFPREARKAAYRKKLESAPTEALAIACADHLANTMDLLAAAKQMTNVWRMFSAGKDEKLRHERAVLDAIRIRLSSPLVEALAAALERMATVP